MSMYPFCFNCNFCDGHCRRVCPICGVSLTLDTYSSDLHKNFLTLLELWYIDKTCIINPYVRCKRQVDRRNKFEYWFELFFYDGININGFYRGWVGESTANDWIVNPEKCDSNISREKQYSKDIIIKSDEYIPKIFNQYSSNYIKKPINNYIWNFKKEPEKWSLN